MAKLAIVAALLMALLALGEATAFTTTTTTTVVEEENPGQICRQQVMGRRFRYCQRLLRQGRMPNDDEINNYDDESSENSLSMVTITHQEKVPSLVKCCQQLSGIDPQCRCDAIRHMMKIGGHEQMAPEMMMKAKYLPRMCRIGPQCQMRAVLV